MPEIPKQTHRPDLHKTVIDLLESIALEEMALAHLLNAEAEKVQAFVGNDLDFPTCPTNHDIMKFNQGVTQFVNTIIMKEWLLLNKLELVLRLRCECEEFEECGE